MVNAQQEKDKNKVRNKLGLSPKQIIIQARLGSNAVSQSTQGLSPRWVVSQSRVDIQMEHQLGQVQEGNENLK